MSNFHFDITAIVLSGGPMTNGWHHAERAGSGTIVWHARPAPPQPRQSTCSAMIAAPPAASGASSAARGERHALAAVSEAFLRGATSANAAAQSSTVSRGTSPTKATTR
jgi:dihydroxyacid dehydratase/phosphogluconate dehydratase